jgi:glutathione S-transferase
MVHAGFKSSAVVAGPLLRMRYGINPESAAEGWEKTSAAMDRLESELEGREYLVGDRFTVADLTAASLFFPIVRPDEAQYQVPEPLPAALVKRRGTFASRPGFQWVQEMYRRHRGESAEVAA